MSLLPTIAGSRLALFIAQLLQGQHNNGIGQIERLFARRLPETVRICKL